MAATPTYKDWKGFLDANPGMAMVLNAGAGDFVFTQEDIKAMDMIVLNQSASHAHNSGEFY